MFVSSAIWRFFARPEKSNAAFGQSAVRKIFNAIFAVPVTLTAGISKRLPGSLTGKIARSLIPLYTSLLGLFILIQTVVPHSYWNNYYALALVIGLYLLYLIKCALGGEGFDFDFGRLDIAFVLFVLSTAVATATSIVLPDSLRVFVYNLIPLFFVFIFVNAVKTRRDMTVIVNFILAGVVLASLYGFYQYIMHVPVDVTLVDVTVSGSVSRIFSTMGNPNNYAEYLVLCLPFFAAAFFNARAPRTKIFILIMSAFPLLNLILTSSRSAWLAFAVSALVYIFLKKRKILPLIVAFALLAYQFLPATITDRLATIGRDSSSKYRISIWETAGRILKDYWVTGLGTGPAPFMKVFQQYNTTMNPPHSHMLLLQIWLEFGLAGIVTFVWMIARFVKKGMDSIFKKRDTYFDNITAAAIAALAGILVNGLFEYVWFYPRVMGMFWIVVAILMTSLNAVSMIKDQ
jgi:O-antigen ligase